MLHLALDLVELAEELERLLADGALVVHPKLVELPPRVREATGFYDAVLEGGFVARVIVADESTVPAAVRHVGIDAEEVTCMFLAAAFREVEDDRFDRAEARRAVAPEVGFVRLALAGFEHRHRRLVGVQDGVGQHPFAQRVDERLQLHAAGADPLRQRRSRDRQASAAEDRFLAVERQVVHELGDQHLGQQARSGDALVDNVRRHRRLHQRLALGADPLATYVAFHREHAGHVVELLGHVFADAL